MEFKETKCKFCGTNKSPIYLMPRASNKYDYWCNDCRDKEIQK